MNSRDGWRTAGFPASLRAAGPARRVAVRLPLPPTAARGRRAARCLLLALVAATALAGCSQSRELKTQGQAAGFVVQVAGGESPSNWTLASTPSAEAAQAWTNRAVSANLGRRLRREGSAWACEFAHKSVGLGSIGYFDENDSGIVSREAAQMGVAAPQIAQTLHDVVALHFRELVLVTTSICGPYKSS